MTASHGERGSEDRLANLDVSEREMGKSEAACTFGVSLSSVKRYVGMASKGESLAPKRRPGSKPKLYKKARKLLAADLEDQPFVTLSERREYLEVVAGVPARTRRCVGR